MTFSFYLCTFSNTLLSHSLSHLNIIFSFIIYFFLTTIYLPIFFFIQHIIIIIEKMYWRMKSSPSDLMGYCSLAKKKFMFVKVIGASTVHLILQILATKARCPNRWRCSYITLIENRDTLCMQGDQLKIKIKK